MAPAPASPDLPVTKRRFLIAAIGLIVLVGVGLFVGGIWHLVDTLWLNRSRDKPRPLFTEAGPPGPASATPAPARVASSASEATREAPFINSFGMRFVPAGTAGELMSVWETRVADFRPFAVAAELKDTGMGVPTIFPRSFEGKDMLGTKFSETATWERPGFPQADDFPVVGVNFGWALKFCDWLTQQGHAAGTLPPEAFYTLPTDEEWSAAVGTGLYAWGDAWPPPAKAANLLDASANKVLSGRGSTIDFDDGAVVTARVGSYAANPYGIHDLTGNVAEWCYGRYRSALNPESLLEKEPSLRREVLWQGAFILFTRGGSWETSAAHLAGTSHHAPAPIFYQSSSAGFRVALVLAPRTGADFNRRGHSAELGGRPAEALADLNRGLALDSTDLLALFSRLQLHKKAKQFREELADYELLYQHHGDVPLVGNDFAWLLATCPDDAVRDGARAVKLAIEACDNTATKNEAYLDTLAAAYAEVGDWENAVAKQREAMELIKGGSPHSVADMKSRLDLYLERKPYRKKEEAEPEPEL